MSLTVGLDLDPCFVSQTWHCSVARCRPYARQRSRTADSVVLGSFQPTTARLIQGERVVVEGMRVAGYAEGEPSPTVLAARQRLADLFDEEFDALYRYCLARTGGPAAADDAASEAFLAASRVFAEGRGDEVDRPWLFVAAKNRMIDQWRSNERQRSRVQKLIRLRRPEWAEIHLDVDDHASDLSELVIAALGSLPERQRAALTLRYLDECSVAEVAEHLDVNYTAAESLLARARRGFATAWKSHHE